MTRDRLADLKRLSMQNGHGGQNGDEVIEMEPAGQTAEKVRLLDPFFQQIETLQDQIHSLKEDIEKIQKLHSFLLLRAGEGDDIRKEIDMLDAKVKKSAVAIKGRLEELTQSNEKLEHKSPNGAELRIRETQLSFLSKWFVDLMTQHSDSQVDYRVKYKDRLKRQLEVMGKDTTSDELDDMIESGDLAVFTDGYLMETENQKRLLAEVTQRRDQILDLERSIKELHDLFLDMALLVSNQGELVDNIERNVRRAGDAVISGQQNLIEAKNKQSAARRKKIICYLILIVVVIILFGGVLGELLGLF